MDNIRKRTHNNTCDSWDDAISHVFFNGNSIKATQSISDSKKKFRDLYLKAKRRSTKQHLQPEEESAINCINQPIKF